MAHLAKWSGMSIHKLMYDVAYHWHLSTKTSVSMFNPYQGNGGRSEMTPASAVLAENHTVRDGMRT